ncbi:hypothetical protein Pla52n_47370 [Stieleria varia]|uniref:Uncharacterized protein n=1 Tax=Stieleria varia TaxID=2528005 RepID=A0A5C6AFM8_9BACT|nr:hypothetical protein Pla52n_47370 [Stieleria varia]
MPPRLDKPRGIADSESCVPCLGPTRNKSGLGVETKIPAQQSGCSGRRCALPWAFMFGPFGTCGKPASWLLATITRSDDCYVDFVTPLSRTFRVTRKSIADAHRYTSAAASCCGRRLISRGPTGHTARNLPKSPAASVAATEESCGVWHFTSVFICEIPSDQIEWEQ